MSASAELVISPAQWNRTIVIALLLLVTLIWGSTFLVVQQTLTLVGPWTFLALRFAVATLILAVVFHQRLTGLTHGELAAGALIGMIIFAAYSLQTLGLQYTTSSKAGFITSLYVPFVPVFGILVLRHWPSPMIWVGVVVSLSGLFLLSLNNQLSLEFGRGEWLILGCAVASAMHIVSVSRFAPHADPIRITVVQLAVTTLLSTAAIPLSGEPLVMPVAPVWWSILFMGVVATAFCLAMMNVAQHYVSSVQATLIYALEPAWAGLFGYFAGEALGLAAWVGCALILLGMVVSSLPLPGARRGAARLDKVTK